ncbi:chlamydia polymorphic membrane middle domain protein, partial [Chlamydia psittaci 02DC23]
CQSSRY